MTVHFYTRQRKIKSHERGAVRRIALALHEAFGHLPRSYTVVSSIPVGGREADLILICERGISIIEIKEAGEKPIYGRHNTLWRREDGSCLTSGNSAMNPFCQVMKTRESFIQLLEVTLPDFLTRARWQQLARHIRKVSAAVVFSPIYHKDSDIYLPPRVRTYFRVLGVNEFVDYAFSLSSDLSFRSSEIHRFAKDILQAQPWEELERVLYHGSDPVGYFAVLEDERSISYVIPVSQSLSIGRSPSNDIVVPPRYGRVSRHHASVEVRGGRVFLTDGQPEYRSTSKHGTYVAGERLSSRSSVKLKDEMEVTLGGAQASSSRGVFCLRFTHRPPKPVLKPIATA